MDEVRKLLEEAIEDPWESDDYHGTFCHFCGHTWDNAGAFHGKEQEHEASCLVVRAREALLKGM